ncbi:peptidyl-prolyl cis-trans isomerase FKBP14 isoform X1 [Rattus norvegicus]|uniref:peptidylprolyl isomerase n=1 Tax=Rattus norvegicus TaxID=10116 RepID=A0ABZ3NNA7_RAT|nr:peptidyl-prolyl cis-trans isomerase FKBP14 isoform X1 [Rattus norvegicus]|eukprot:XP_017448176.1 PREDICTED: peptidyl-prolyl cis-trans isomerase FKBP14 isoform X1 [Rattus norvegicus]
MRFFLWNANLTLWVTVLSGALIPEPEVKIEVLQKPFICHRKTKGGDLMLVHYEGYLEKDGSLFHSTHKHNNGQPVWFTLGILEVLKGWDQGLKGMCVGEKRKLTIPPALGYGKEGKGKIPPESTLIFNIDLLEIRNGPRSHESFQEMDLNDDWKLSKHELLQRCAPGCGCPFMDHSGSCRVVPVALTSCYVLPQWSVELSVVKHVLEIGAK